MACRLKLGQPRVGKEFDSIKRLFKLLLVITLMSLLIFHSKGGNNMECYINIFTETAVAFMINYQSEKLLPA